MKKHQILKLRKVNYYMNFKSEFENNYLRLYQAQIVVFKVPSFIRIEGKYSRRIRMRKGFSRHNSLWKHDMQWNRQMLCNMVGNKDYWICDDAMRRAPSICGSNAVIYDSPHRLNNILHH